MPPKWSPCKCDTSTASIDVGASPNRASPINDDVPQSSSTCVLALRSEIAAWRRPPLPKASPEPTNCTVIMSGASVEHKSVALEHARSRRFRSRARQPVLSAPGRPAWPRTCRRSACISSTRSASGPAPYRTCSVDTLGTVPEVQHAWLALARTAEGPNIDVERVERFAFYERARQAFAVVATSESRRIAG